MDRENLEKLQKNEKKSLKLKKAKDDMELQKLKFFDIKNVSK
jgi:hypothetical protein